MSDRVQGQTPAEPPISIAEMRRRYLKLFTGAVNDVLRFKYKMHSSSLPAEFSPLRDDMKIAGPAFTVKGGPDITTDGEFEMRARMLESLQEDSVVTWDCSGDRVTAQWGEVMTMAAVNAGCRGAIVNWIRDTNAILGQEFAVFHRYRCSTGMLGRFRLYHYQKPILMGEVTVRPGDWIYGDIDGVVAVPAEMTYDVLLAAGCGISSIRTAICYRFSNAPMHRSRFGLRARFDHAC